MGIVSYQLFCSDGSISLADLSSFYNKLLKGYIWQDESLRFAKDESFGGSYTCFSGQTDFGDCVDDEWLIVSFFMGLSEKYSSLAIQIADEDGEFLLIEAAEHLPDWLEPETAENRVFLCRGQVCIVPTSCKSATEQLKLKDALDYLFTNYNNCIATPSIQKCIKRRAGTPNEKITANLFHFTCFLPAKLVVMLKNNTQLISQLVQRLHNCTPADMRNATMSSLSYFEADTRVFSQVTFTKCLYAMVFSQNCLIPPLSKWAIKVPPTDRKFNAFTIGTRLTLAAEMLCRDEASATCQLPTTFSTAEWKSFHDSLVSRGYFRNLLPKSREYVQLLDEAKTYFAGLKTPPSDQKTSILKTLNETTADLENLRAAETDLPPDDDSSWLNVSPDQLDDVLSRHFGGAGGGGAGGGGAGGGGGNGDKPTSDQPVGKLAHMVDDVKRLLSSTSDVYGVQIPKEKEEEEKEEEEKEERKKLKGKRETTVDSMMNDFRQSLITDLKLFEPAEDELSPTDDTCMSEYGSDMDDPLELAARTKPLPERPQRQTVVDEAMDVELEEKLKKPPAGHVDVDVQLAKSIVESASAAQGMPSATSSMIGAIRPAALADLDDL